MKNQKAVSDRDPMRVCVCKFCIVLLSHVLEVLCDQVLKPMM